MPLTGLTQIKSSWMHVILSKQYHRIMKRFGFEGTFKDHLVHPLTI